MVDSSDDFDQHCSIAIFMIIVSIRLLISLSSSKSMTMTWSEDSFGFRIMVDFRIDMDTCQ